MATLKCKMCGGDLNIIEGETVAVCEYCGTKQTLPRLDNDRKINMYDRANHFRRNNDYDKAMSIYENILNEDKTDAEAYWSLVLCRYGIEYVKDPATHKRVPTVNRAQFTSVFMDEDYKSAIEYADPVQKSVYEAEAKAIDEIQKGILEISQKEEPFDVFICYKETDANGRRTQDSVLANDLYHQLTQEGFKVFFSRITLEDKLGTAYEPYIFAALNSAKVMVVLGTKPEYFNAVWVKNEWSRYLALIKNGAKKILIPAYRDMDPYDLPEEFSHLQAQDMSKLGFMQDLIRGIKKIVGDNEPKSVQKDSVVVNNANANTVPLLKRAFIFLEDGDWQAADEYCEKVLDLDPENTIAYLGKLMAGLKVRKREELKNCEKPFNNEKNYQKAFRFGDSKIKAELAGYIDFIKKRNENARFQEIYSQAIHKMNYAETDNVFLEAAEIFESIEKYKDSKELAKQCREKGKEAYYNAQYDKAVNLLETANNEEDCKKAKKIFEKLGDFKEPKLFLDKYEKKLEDIRKNTIYNKAISLKNKPVTDDIDQKIENINEAIDIFITILGWRDAEEQAELCFKEIEKIKAEQKSLEEKEIKRKKHKKQLLIMFSSMTVIVLVFVILFINVFLPQMKYDNAEKLVSDGKYDQAMVIYKSLDDYKDSKEKVEECYYFTGDVISVGSFFTLGLKTDGTVLATGNNEYGQCDVSSWKDIVAVSAGEEYSLGLRTDGTVLATGNNEGGQCNVSDWKDIVAISAGSDFSVGLKSDGTVVATGDNSYGQCDVSDWHDIVSVSAGYAQTVGLKSDGTVVAAGGNSDNQCDVSSWRDIIAIAAGGMHTVGLKSEGTVVVVGGYEGRFNVSDWSDIVDISAGDFYVVGSKSDGTVVAVGNNTSNECDVSGWSDITSISAGSSNTVGLKSDGTVVAVGSNIYGESDVSGWSDILVRTTVDQ